MREAHGRTKYLGTECCSAVGTVKAEGTVGRSSEPKCKGQLLRDCFGIDDETVEKLLPLFKEAPTCSTRLEHLSVNLGITCVTLYYNTSGEETRHKGSVLVKAWGFES